MATISNFLNLYLQLLKVTNIASLITGFSTKLCWQLIFQNICGIFLNFTACKHLCWGKKLSIFFV